MTCSTSRRPAGAARAVPLWVLLPLALLPLALFAWAGCERAAKRAVAEVPTPVPVQVETVAPSRNEVRRRYSGYTHPWEAHGVGFLVAGRVTAIHVQEGDHVQAGQVIATLASEDYELTRRLADVQLRTLRPNLQRVRKLVETGALAQAQLDTLQGQYDAAWTQKQQAERQLAYTVLEAPCDGVVLEKRASVGQVTAAGLPVVVLLDLSRLKARFGVPQRDLGHFREGDRLTLTFPGVPGERTGTVTQLADVPDTLTRTYDVVAAVDNPDGALKAGMLVHTTIVTEALEGLFVPLDAVKRTNAGVPVVMLADPAGAKAIERPVTLGRFHGDHVALVEGVAPGDRVIVRGQHYVRDGEAVAVVEGRPALSAAPAAASSGGGGE